VTNEQVIRDNRAGFEKKSETKFGMMVDPLHNIKNKNSIELTQAVRFLFQVINENSLIIKFRSTHNNCLIVNDIGLVAQWLEHTLDKRGVESSTLSRPTIELRVAQNGKID